MAKKDLKQDMIEPKRRLIVRFLFWWVRGWTKNVDSGVESGKHLADIFKRGFGPHDTTDQPFESNKSVRRQLGITSEEIVKVVVRRLRLESLMFFGLGVFLVLCGVSWLFGAPWADSAMYGVGALTIGPVAFVTALRAAWRVHYLETDRFIAFMPWLRELYRSYL